MRSMKNKKKTHLGITSNSAMYGNGLMTSPSGKPLCRMSMKRLNWYLERDLAILISENPPTIQLKFEPKGEGEDGDSYMMDDKRNICVVCGTDKELTKHHVVPYCYKTSMPDVLKKHSSYDVLLLCAYCHDKYEKKAYALRRELAKEYDAPISGISEAVYDDSVINMFPKGIKNKDIDKAISYAYALQKHGPNIPSEKKNRILEFIAKTIGHDPINEELLVLSQSKRRHRTNMTHGSIVMNKIKSVEEMLEFMVRWRKHFVSSMNPKFLSDKWTPDTHPRAVREWIKKQGLSS